MSGNLETNQNTTTTAPDSTLNFRSQTFLSRDISDTSSSIRKVTKIDTSSAPARFFTQERQEPVEYRPEPVIRSHNEWQLFTLAFSLLIISVIRLSGRNFFRNLRQGFFSRPIFRQLLRDGELLPSGSTIPLLLANLAVMVTFFYQIDETTNLLNLTGQVKILSGVAKLSLYLTGYFTIKIFIMLVLGFIFKTETTIREYISNILYFNTLTTIVLIPLCFFSIYSVSTAILWAGIFTVIFLILFRIFRGLLIAFEIRSYAVYQIFLYLCALEILPAIVLVKLLIG